MLAPGACQLLAGGYAIPAVSTIDEIRHRNLLDLIERHQPPKIQNFANAIGRSHSQVSQIKTRARHSSGKGPRKIGDDLARDIERRLGLDEGWMDRQHLVAGEPAPHWEVAQVLSHAASNSPLITWGENMHKDLPQKFRVAAPDDSMAPRVRAGELLEFDTSLTPRPGDGVLVADDAGRCYFRTFREGRLGQWEAVAENRAFRELDSERDGLRVLAVMTAVFQRWG